MAKAVTGYDSAMDYLKALAEPSFRKLWSAQILSQVAQNLLNFALIIQVFNATQGSRFGNVAVSLLILAFGVPSILFATFAGAMVDRWDRRLVMVASNTMRAGLVLLYIPLQDHLLGILLLSFTISVIMQFFVPAEAATIPQVVPKRSLLMANSLFVFSLYASFIVGYALASPVIVGFGEQGPYLLTAGMFALAGGLSLFLPRTHRQPRAPLPKFELRSELKSSYQVVRSHRWIALAIRQLTITQSIVGVIMALAPALSVALLHRPLQHASTYLIIPAGIGMVVGVAAVGHLARRWSKIAVMEIGLIVAGVALALLGMSSLLYRTYDNGYFVVTGPHIAVIVAVLVFALGMLNAIISSMAQTVLQENSSEQTRGKVFGALNMFINLAGTLPILLTGILADLLSVTTVITVIGGLVIVFASVQLWRARRHFGNIIAQ